MDILSLFGLSLGILAVLGGQILEGGEIRALLNGPALFIVLGGSAGAVFLETPWKHFKNAIAILPWLILPPRVNFDSEIQKIIMWSHVARKQGLLGLEAIAEKEVNDFSRKGLFLLVDGNEPKALRSILSVELENNEENLIQSAKVYESFGGYTPTLGILGAVLGLIQVMNNLGDPNKLGSGIAVAFIATIYGVGFANLFFLPAAKKLQQLLRDYIMHKEMIVEGLISIAEGENPRLIEIKLQGFL